MVGGACKNTKNAFSLLELTVVLVVVGLITAMAMNSGNAALSATRETATRQKMKALEDALQAYRESNNRLPCPASLTIAEGVTNFGVEAATPGTCTGGTPAANYSAAGATNTAKTGVEGAVPVVTLGLPGDFMYDGWGRRLRYVVDKSATSTNAFSSIATACTNLAVKIKDANGSSRTGGAVYALISHGENGHGGYTKAGGIVNAGSTNTDEQTNCHCTAAAVAGTYAPTYVQKAATINAASTTDSFDDLVTYKERWQMLTAWETQDSCVYYIAVYPAGDQSVQVFDNEGNWLFRKRGDEDTGSTFSGAYSGIAFDASGLLWVADGNNHRAVLYSTNGVYDRTVAYLSQAEGPIYISSLNGHIFVRDDYDDNIREVTVSGSTVTNIQSIGGATLSAPVPGGVNSSGDLWVADTGHNRIIRYTISGATSSQAQVVPSDCTVSCTSSSASGRFNAPTDVKVDSEGNIWVADSGNNRVIEFNSAGTSVTQTINTWNTTGAQTFGTPTGLAFDSNGKLWVADRNGNRLVSFSISGASATYFSTIPSSCANAPCSAGYNNDGELSNPIYLAIGGR